MFVRGTIHVANFHRRHIFEPFSEFLNRRRKFFAVPAPRRIELNQPHLVAICVREVLVTQVDHARRPKVARARLGAALGGGHGGGAEGEERDVAAFMELMRTEFFETLNPRGRKLTSRLQERWPLDRERERYEGSDVTVGKT